MNRTLVCGKLRGINLHRMTSKNMGHQCLGDGTVFFSRNHFIAREWGTDQSPKRNGQ